MRDSAWGRWDGRPSTEAFSHHPPSWSQRRPRAPHLDLLSLVLPTAAALGAELPRSMKRQDAAGASPEQRLGTLRSGGVPLREGKGAGACGFQAFTRLAKRGSSS